MWQFSEEAVILVGHAVQLNIERPDPVDPKPRIEVEGLTIRNEESIVKLKDVSFTANSGEILGIAGISGCGQKELLEAIAGLQPIESGTINYIEPDGSKEMLIGKDPLKIAEMGVSLSFVPEDRLGMGLVGNMDLTDNMMLRSFRKGKTPFVNRKPSRKLAESVVKDLAVVTPGITTPVRRLSGGNVQKVLLGRADWISIRPIQSMICSMSRRKRAWQLSLSEKIWMYWWNCLTGSWYFAEDRSAVL